MPPVVPSLALTIATTLMVALTIASDSQRAPRWRLYRARVLVHSLQAESSRASKHLFLRGGNIKNNDLNDELIKALLGGSSSSITL